MWRKVIPNLFTLGALVAATIAIIEAAHGGFLAAAQLIMLALILDGLDGNVARWCKGSTTFGAELDTFLDVIAYGVAPAILAYEVTMGDRGFWGLAFVVLTVMSGAMRLARFRVVDPFRGQHGFLGLPITVNAAWISLFVFIQESGQVPSAWMSLTEGPLATIVWTASLAFLFLQVSTVRYTKPSKSPLFFAAGVLLVMMLFLDLQVAVAAAFALLGYGAFFAFVSPFFPRHAEVIETTAETDEDEEDEPVGLRPS